MSDDNTGLVVASICLGFMLGLFVGAVVFLTSRVSHTDLIEKGHGEYNGKTGEFQLIEVKSE